jgi:argininosuccinate lyase
MAGMVTDLEPMRAHGRRGRLRLPTATDLADWLVRELGLPFREPTTSPARP